LFLSEEISEVWAQALNGKVRILTLEGYDDTEEKDEET